MKKLFAILICLCLTLVPLNVTASGSLETVAADNTVTQTPIENGGITITPSGNTPEELAIQKIIAHKRALGEEIPVETMSASNEPEDDGIYYIKNYFSGKYLNVHYGVDANGTNVYQWTSDSSTEQKFKIKKDQANNCYKIYAMCSSNGTNRVLDVVRNGAALASGQNVDIWTPVDHTAQRMIFTYLTYDIYHIRMNANTNMYLTSYGNSNGTSGGKTATSAGNVFIQSFDVNDNQQWELILIDSPNPEPEPEPEPSTPYGWLDEVTANGIRGWAWCESLPEAALNVEIQLYKNNALVDTFSLVADIYRSDVAASDFGTGYYGFQYNIDWSEYPAGEYTVRAFAGINTPDTELHDSEMVYKNNLSYLYTNEVTGSAFFLALDGYENYGTVIPISSRVVFKGYVTVLNNEHIVTKVSCYASATKHTSYIDQPFLNIGAVQLDGRTLSMNIDRNFFPNRSLIELLKENNENISVGDTVRFDSIAILMVKDALWPYYQIENNFVFEV